MEKLSCNNCLQWPKIQSSILQYVRQIKQKNYYLNLHQLVKSCAQHIDQNFLINCIKICVFRQLSPMISENQDTGDIHLLQKIRQTYFKMSTQGVWKQQFKFQSGIVCITKLISQFFNQAFIDIKVNERLEAEIYIILIYVIMGIRVGLKSFPVLQNKYLKQKKLPRKTFMKQRESSEKHSESLSSSFYNHSLDRKSILQKKTTLIEPEDQRNPVQLFAQFLKESLYVAPLPQLVKQKQSIQFYSKRQEAEQMVQSHVSTPKQSQQLDQNKYRKFPFLSTQLSVSMHSQIVQRNVSIATQCKPLKIKQRNPYFSNHNLVFRNSHGKDSQHLDQQYKSKDKQKQQKWRLTSKEWSQAISQIKGHFANHDEKRVQKLEKAKRFHRQMETDNKLQMNQNLNNSYRKLKVATDGSLGKMQIQKQSCLTPPLVGHENGKNLKTSQQQQNSKKVSLIAGVKQYRQHTEPKSYNYLIDLNTTKIDRKTLKSSQKKFYVEASERRQKIDYSMFKFPSKGIGKKDSIHRHRTHHIRS